MDVIYTHYSTKMIAELIRKEYGFDELDYCRVLRARDNNDMYQLKVNNEIYVARLATLKFTKYVKKEADYNYEVNLLRYLATKEINVVQPVKNAKGKYIISIDAPEGKRFLVLFKYVKGKMEFKVTRGIAFAYGEYLAKIHRACDEFDEEFHGLDKKLEYWFNQPLALIREYFTKHADVRRLLLNLDGAEELIKGKFDQIKDEDGSIGLIHTDFGPHNTLQDYDKLTFLDFDTIGVGYRIFDVAYCAQTFKRHGNDIEVIEDFYKGYESIRKLQQAEKDVIMLISEFIMQIWGVGGMVKQKDRIGSWYVDMPGNINYMQSLIKWFSEYKQEQKNG
ncbi:MAG: phosphotransferase [Candidatus Heimdallarchaeota archaeon]|nr:phosphotransferase [Candidatus Heimdallarchaeota archaeon]